MGRADTTVDKGRFDHSSDPRFLEYYARESQSEETIARFSRIMDRALGLLGQSLSSAKALDVIDIGCGAGTQALMWAKAGHRVRAIDINGPLVAVGQARAGEQNLPVRFVVGSATQLPYETASADVVLLPELLEHVVDWEACLAEAVRVLRGHGLLYLSTSNRLCPRQQEFNLPLYSWYPSLIKHWCERKAVTTHPEWANHARYPAVHWFTYYELRDWLGQKGLSTLDRFDVLSRRPLPPLKRLLTQLVVNVPPIRFLGHMATEGTTVWARKGL
jgi:2-polyprenyl-6-hydroxyphenyl methylase/3-demethylubiquinone-9 3-methyltransferase